MSIFNLLIHDSFFNFNFFLRFIYFCLGWVFVAACRLSLVVVSGGYSKLQCGLFISVVFLVEKHRLSSCAWA